MLLIGGVHMLFILRHGDSKILHLESGSIEKGLSGLNVYDEEGGLIKSLSGVNIRSWCLIGPEGQRVPGWSDILADDYLKFVIG